jgi:7-cyano-7-deazaguanine synthase
VYALSFSYGQKHTKELEFAKNLAKKAGAKEHKIVNIALNSWGGCSLTDDSMEIKTGNTETSDIPDTYVPARNMVFLSVAASYAEATKAQDIFIGISQVDYSGYVDCRQEFIDAMEKAINQGTELAVEQKKPIMIRAPFINKTKAEEIILGLELGLDFADTWSCYKGGEKPCGECDSCLLRANAFAEAGVEDTLLTKNV